MNSISMLNLLTAILGFTVAGILIFFSRHNRFVNRFLGIAFFALAYRSLSMYVLDQNLVSNNFLLGSISFLYFLTPVSFYLYFRSTINDEQSLKKTDWLHFLIPISAAVLMIYYIIRGYVVYGHFELPANQNVFNETREFPLHILTKEHLTVLLGMCILYLFLSWKLLLQKLKVHRHQHPQAKKVRNWVMTLLLTCSLLLVVMYYHVFWALIFNTELKNLPDPVFVRSVILVIIFTRVFFQPDLLFGIPRITTTLPVVDHIPNKPALEPFNDVQIETEPEAKETATEKDLYFDQFGWLHQLRLETDEDPKLRNVPDAPMEKDQVVFYIRKINSYMQTAPYTDFEFDMKYISRELQLPLYHIEYLFRYYNQLSFTEFRNILRVQHVLREFERGPGDDDTIETIGLKAGFNSRSSFFRIFKTVTDKTPKQVLEEIESRKPKAVKQAETLH